MTDPHLDSPQEGFRQKWDPLSHHEIVNTTATTTVNRLSASQVILETLKTKRKVDPSEWLNGLEKESSTDFVAPEVETTMIGQAIQWLDKMFVQFELYASTFNMNVQGTNLVVSCTRPIKRTDNNEISYGENNENYLSYAGHIATQLWALVVRGCATKVEIFIIPSELLIAFSLNSADESGYEPLLLIESGWVDKNIIWHVQNNIITQEQIPSLAKELFGDLIKVASGQMSEAELMANPLPETAPNLEPNNHQQPLATIVASTIKSNLNSQPVSSMSPNMTPENAAKSSQSVSISPDTINAIENLLAVTNRDINSLIQSGKGALELDNTSSFENIKVLTEILETLKNSLSIALANINRSSAK